ncbi:MAG: phosphatidate cytidylyltransferase [Comamonadaceae bacterium]|nr:phosphatidate cytidylyltransferase [Comamonadaceae bacterium]
MTEFLGRLTPDQQVTALFLFVFGILILATAALLALSLRERGSEEPGEGKPGFGHAADLQHGRTLLRHSWFMALIFWCAWATGNTAATVLFALVSFLALREFITLSPTRRGDHRSLVLAFFVVLPVQYWLVGSSHFNLFTVFIPVYVFLAIPVVSALADDPQGFLERTAKVQWGIMVCVFGLSHVPALLLLNFPGWSGRNAFLVFFLAIVVQSCMLAQHLANRYWPGRAHAPNVSSSFSWRNWFIGIGAGALVGVMLTGVTPFDLAQAAVMSVIAGVAGSLGHLVMKALKRDRGVTNWGGHTPSVTGASGLLDRVDALCFAAPVFFHSVRWYFGI